jgi:hypothetical protein
MRKYKTSNKPVLCDLEKNLLDRIVNNKTRDGEFDYGVYVNDENSEPVELVSYYTSRGQLFIIDAWMQDNPFRLYADKDKKIISDAITKKLGRKI